jgi:hypothetical protein
MGGTQRDGSACQSCRGPRVLAGGGIGYRGVTLPVPAPHGWVWLCIRKSSNRPHSGRVAEGGRQRDSMASDHRPPSLPLACAACLRCLPGAGVWVVGSEATAPVPALSVD